MSNQVKIEKLQSIISRDLTLIMQREIKGQVLSGISISEVKLTNDLSHAKVYYSSLMSKDKDELQSTIDRYRKKIRSKLAHKLDTYKCPELEFIYDDSLDNANKIEAILKKVKE